MLFTIFFKIEPMALASSAGGPIEVRIENINMDMSFVKKEIEIESNKSSVKSKKSNPKVKKKLTLPKVKKLRPPVDSKKIKDDDLKDSMKKSIKDSEVAHTSRPFSVSGELKKRKIIQSPELPIYPKWALEADVELKMKIGVLVNKDGSVKRAWVIDPSGDSQTDNKILIFTENLKFETESYLSKGEISWEFKLKY